MIYLHIGSPKTGTTTIQSGLVDNRDVLFRNGYLYPKVGIKFWGHHNLFWDMTSDQLFEPSLGNLELLCKNLTRYKANNPNGNIIISSEAFFRAYKFVMVKLMDELSKIDEVKIIVYLREQASYYLSFWSAFANRGKTKMKYEKWATNAIEINFRKGDYLARIRELETLVEKPENLIIKCYSKKDTKGHFKNFLAACNYEGDSNDLKHPEAINKDRYKGHFSIPESIHALCSERYSADNEVLARKYFGRTNLFV